MELLAVIQALELLQRPSSVEVFTDSKYLHDAVNKGWLVKWRHNGWQTSANKPVKNQDLWLRLNVLLERHEVRFAWVRGHAGDPENERCNTLAGAAALGPDLAEDDEYVRG
jgi:ribonuclease HI